MNGWIGAATNPPGADNYLVVNTLTEAVAVAYFTKARGWEDEMGDDINNWVAYWQPLPEMPTETPTDEAPAATAGSTMQSPREKGATS